MIENSKQGWGRGTGWGCDHGYGSTHFKAGPMGSLKGVRPTQRPRFSLSVLEWVGSCEVKSGLDQTFL